MKIRNKYLIVIAAILMTASTTTPSKALLGNASSHDISIESSLEMEEWMINDSYWMNPDFESLIKEDVESNLRIESWMTAGKSWKAENKLPKVEKEKELKLEHWMTDDNYWK